MVRISPRTGRQRLAEKTMYPMDQAGELPVFKVRRQ